MVETDLRPRSKAQTSRHICRSAADEGLACKARIAIKRPRWLDEESGSGGFAEDEADDRDDGGVVLNGAFEFEGFVIGAMGTSRVFAAGFGASFVNGAAAGFGMQKFAGFAEERVFRAFEDPSAIHDFRVFACRLFDGNSKMGRQTLDVEISDFDALVDRATEGNAFRAVIMQTRFFGGHGFLLRVRMN